MFLDFSYKPVGTVSKCLEADAEVTGGDHRGLGVDTVVVGNEGAKLNTFAHLMTVNFDHSIVHERSEYAKSQSACYTYWRSKSGPPAGLGKNNY